MEHILEKKVKELEDEIKWLKEIITNFSKFTPPYSNPQGIWDPFGGTTTGAPIMNPAWKCKVNGEQ